MREAGAAAESESLLSSLASVNPTSFAAIDDPSSTELAHASRASKSKRKSDASISLDAPRPPDAYRFVRFELSPLSSRAEREHIVSARLKQFGKELQQGPFASQVLLVLIRKYCVIMKESKPNPS